MSQTVTQNSALSQDWVKCTVCTQPWPRLRPGPIVSWRTRRYVAGLPRPYRGLPLGYVTARTGRVASHVTCYAARCVAARPAARRVIGLLGRVVSTASSIVALPGRVSPPSWRAQACVPAQPAVCLLSLLCACSACCVPA